MRFEMEKEIRNFDLEIRQSAAGKVNQKIIGVASWYNSISEVLKTKSGQEFREEFNLMKIPIPTIGIQNKKVDDIDKLEASIETIKLRTEQIKHEQNYILNSILSIEIDNIQYKTLGEVCEILYGTRIVKNEMYKEGIDLLEKCVQEESSNEGYKYLLAVAYWWIWIGSSWY